MKTIATQNLSSVEHWPNAFQNLTHEYDHRPLGIEGNIPHDLQGTLYRNGPALFNSFDMKYQHFFDGDGAVSQVKFQEGKAFGAIRLVQSKMLLQERAQGKPLSARYGTKLPTRSLETRLHKNAANTSVLFWQGRLFALWEGSLPTELDPETLATLGETDLSNVILLNFSAHPHFVPERKAFYNFGVRLGQSTQLDLYELSEDIQTDYAKNQARKLHSLNLPFPTMIHDFIATAKHLIFFISPLQLDARRFLSGESTYSDSLVWQPQQGTKILLVPIDQPDQIQWMETEPFFQFHFSHAFEQGNQIMIDFVRYPDFSVNTWLGSLPSGKPIGESQSQFVRCILDQSKTQNQTRFETILDQSCEFPQISPFTIGQQSRYVYLTLHSQTQGATQAPYQLVGKLDTQTGKTEEFSFGINHYPSEPIFVPKKEQAQASTIKDNGYLLSLVYDGNAHKSYVGVLDAQHFEKGVLAKVWFEHHIPFTFHGTWVPHHA